MLEKLNEDELMLMDTWFYPVAEAEILFSDFDNLARMDGDTLGHIRLGQLPLLSYEYLLDDKNPNLTKKQNFQLRKGMGDIYCFGGRLFGKTLILEKIDLMISMVLQESEKVGFTSADASHIEGVLEDILYGVENHPFFKLYDPTTKRSPYTVKLRTGYHMLGVNMNVYGKHPGKNFFQKHFTRLYIEEASLETDEVYKKRRDSVSELGCVYRVAGMTDFIKHSPCGRIMDNLEKRPWLCNLPQYVNPNWNEKSKQDAIKDFGGEHTIEFRIFIKGEIVEDAITVFDMSRIRPQYNQNRLTKVFEINKDSFSLFEQVIIVERPSNVDNVFIASDIGESAPTEIAVFFEINKKYRYVYNITLYNLTDKEQFKIFKFLGEELKANYIGLDTSDGTGRAIFRSLEEVFPKDNLNWVSFQEKIAVDYEKEKDDKGIERIIMKSGKPVEKKEYVTDWSVKRLQHLLYGEKMDLPVDNKFDTQFNKVKCFKTGNRVQYKCINAGDDHLWQAWQVFSIMQWDREWCINIPIPRTVFCKTGI